MKKLFKLIKLFPKKNTSPKPPENKTLQQVKDDMTNLLEKIEEEIGKTPDD
jgi:hypothetical protein